MQMAVWVFGGKAAFWLKGLRLNPRGFQLWLGTLRGVFGRLVGKGEIGRSGRQRLLGKGLARGTTLVWGLSHAELFLS